MKFKDVTSSDSLDESILKIISDEELENKSESDPEQNFESYVKKVRKHTKPIEEEDTLFHCCLLVSLNVNIPFVKSKYPDNVQVPYKIEDLCFPEIQYRKMDTHAEAQCYSLLITNEFGERTFGYCRRVIPEDSAKCLPLAYCILSKHRASDFYQRILKELELRHGYPDRLKHAFLEELYNCKFPLPGQSIVIYSETEKEFDAAPIVEAVHEVLQIFENKFSISARNKGDYGTFKNNPADKAGTYPPRSFSSKKCSPNVLLLMRSVSFPFTSAELDSSCSKLIFHRPPDSRHEGDDLIVLMKNIKQAVLLKVFATLLLERKVIFISSILSKLSSCIEALHTILYPFSWQHTIIPVLPRTLWEIVDTPTPLICGILSRDVVTEYYYIENGFVVDLDAGEVLLQVGDEDKILPNCLVQILNDGLCLANTMASSNSATYNVFLSDAFLRVFVQSCAHYKNHINDEKFEKAEFIYCSKPKGKHISKFLKWFTETTMFYNFLETAFAGNTRCLDLFEQRIEIYSSVTTAVILKKIKSWTK